MRLWKCLNVTVLDQLKEELHLFLIILDGDSLIQPMDPGEIILSQEQRVEPVNALGDVGEVPAVRVSNARAWDYTVNIWESVQDGSLKNMDCKCLLIPRTDGQGVKGLHHIDPHSVISNGVPDCLQHLSSRLGRVDPEVHRGSCRGRDDIYLDSCIKHGDCGGRSNQGIGGRFPGKDSAKKETKFFKEVEYC